MVWATLIQNVQPVHMPYSYRLLLVITTVNSQDSRKLDTFAGFFVCLGLMLYTVTEMLLLLISSLLMVGKLKIVYLTLHPEKLASKKFGYLACDR